MHLLVRTEGWRYKCYNSTQPHKRDAWEQGGIRVGYVELPCHLCYSILPTALSITNLEALLMLPFGNLYWCPYVDNDYLNYKPLMSIETSSLSSPPQRLGTGRTKRYSILIIILPFWCHPTILKISRDCQPTSISLVTRKWLIFHWLIPKVLGILCQGQQSKTAYFFVCLFNPKVNLLQFNESQLY